MDDPNLDELFGGGTGQAEPRARLVMGLLAGGVTLAALGMLCSAVPGGIIVLIAWHQLERESERLEAGYLAQSAAPVILKMQAMTYFSVTLVTFLFVAQAFLFAMGFYDSLWQAMIAATLGWLLVPA